MKLYLIRHGQSIGNTKPGYISGRSDPDGLTITGKAQIVRTAWDLKDLSFNAIYSSPVARARESAEILSHLLSVPHEPVPFLEEFNYGVFECKYWWIQTEEERNQWKQAMQNFSVQIPGGDSYENFSERLWQGYQGFVQKIDREQPGAVLFVSHDVVISTLLFSLLYGHPSRHETTTSYKNAYIRFINDMRVPNGSATIVDLSKDQPSYETIQTTKDSIVVSRQSITTYMRGMWGTEEIEITEEYTASENKVFHIQGEQNAIVKLIEERDIVASERMVQIYTYLRDKTDIPAPEILFYDKSHAFFTDTVLVQDFLDGQNQLAFMKNRPENIQDVLEHVFDMVRSIHQIPVHDVEEFWYPDDISAHKVHVPWHRYIEGEIRLTMESIKAFDLSTEQKQKLQQELQQLLVYAQTQDYPVGPLHGDLAPLNIIFSEHDENSVCARMLDFERARIGDPLWDYAYYCGWLDRDLPKAVSIWQQLIQRPDAAQQLGLERRQEVFNRYRLLFHAWTTRDSIEYKGSELRSDRAKVSLLWLQNNLS